jgi:chorismate dehydratase
MSMSFAKPCTVAVPAYLNSRAYFHHPLPEGCVLSPLYPRDAATALAEGRVQAGLLPVAVLPALAGQVTYLGEYGIGAAGPVRSVLLHACAPLAELNAAHVLHLTGQSATSVRLLGLLIGYRSGFRNLPMAADGDGLVDGQLLIGDAALCSRGVLAYPHVTDLAEAWRADTGLPFVFARWVIRRDASPALRAALEGWLAAFAMERRRLDCRVAEREAARYGLTPGDAYRYLQGMHTTLDAAHLSGQALFLEELARHRPVFRPAAVERRVSCA